MSLHPFVYVIKCFATDTLMGTNKEGLWRVSKYATEKKLRRSNTWLADGRVKGNYAVLRVKRSVVEREEAERNSGRDMKSVAQSRVRNQEVADAAAKYLESLGRRRKFAAPSSRRVGGSVPKRA